MPTQGNIIVKDVILTKFNVEFLYDLLKDRSKTDDHFHLPSYKQHYEYLSASPYLSFKIAFYKKIPLGCVFISRDKNIGIYLSKNNIKSCIRSLKGLDLSSTMIHACLRSLDFPPFLCTIHQNNILSNNAANKLSNFKDIEKKYNVELREQDKYNIYEFRRH